MADNRDMQALDYDPAYNKKQYKEDYNEIKTQGKREGQPDVQPHHIRGLNNYHDAWKRLSLENRLLLQDELRPYGLVLGNDKDNLVAAEGQWSKSTPGQTRYGGQHAQLHKQQEDAMQKMGVDRKGAAYRSVAGVPWDDMSQEQLMGFIRSMAVKDEITMNQTLSLALPITNTARRIQQQKRFGNRLTGTADTLDIMFQAQGSSLEEAAEISTRTFQNREAGAEIARKEGGLLGMPDLGITETLAGFSLIGGARQQAMKRHLL